MDEAVSHLWPKAEVSIPIRLLAVPTRFKLVLTAVSVNLRYKLVFLLSDNQQPTHRYLAISESISLKLSIVALSVISGALVII